MEPGTTTLNKNVYTLEVKHPLSKCPIPIYTSAVSAGFPSPAENCIEESIDLNEILVKHPTGTFFVRVKGDSMKDAGINSGDTLIVDKTIRPQNGNVVVASVNGEFTVKRFFKVQGGVRLAPENPGFKDIVITQESEDLQVWGVVTYVIHKV